MQDYGNNFTNTRANSRSQMLRGEEGIFYHALRPVEPEDEMEIKEYVEYAVKNLTARMSH